MVSKSCVVSMLLASLLLPPAVAQEAPPRGTAAEALPLQPRQALTDALRTELQLFQQRSDVPGVSAAVVLSSGKMVAVAAGVRDLDTGAKLESGDRMFCGSIGKTWFASVALQLIADGKLALDDKIAKHLGHVAWFARLPNHESITVRHLMRHESGLPRWIEMPGALAEMARPDRVWKNGDQVTFVLDKKPLHAAGDGWAYSDTNYIVLGLIVEAVMKRPIYDLVQDMVIAEHRLMNTLPGNQRRIPGLVQGHVRLFARFGFPKRSLLKGKLQFDPAAEWCGGGIVTTAGDLARWARIYGSAKYRATQAVPADRLGKGTKYGLGVMLRDTELGPTRGHDGVFIGYGATMMWFEEHDISVGVLVNTDGAGRHLSGIAVQLAKLATEHVAASAKKK